MFEPRIGPPKRGSYEQTDSLFSIIITAFQAFHKPNALKLISC